MKLLRSLAASLLVFAVTSSALAQRTIEAKRISDVSMSELAAMIAAPPMARETRHAEKRVVTPSLPGPSGDRKRVARNAAQAATIAAPPIALGFHAHTSKRVSPADASGAVGPNHIVGITNGGFTVHDRRGVQLANVWINQFWNDGVDSNEYYDPRIAYDEKRDRWIAMAIFEEQSIMIGVSATGDPLGTWMRYRLQIADVDFSRIAITRDEVVLSTMHFQGSYIGDTGSMLRLAKNELYSGATTFSVPRTVVYSGAVPVHAPDSPIAYTVEPSDSEIIIRRLDQPGASPKIVHAGFQWEYSWNHYAPQLATSVRLDTNYPEAVAELRNGALYVVHKVGFLSSEGERSSILWWKVNPETGARLDVGTIDDPSGAIDYAYPSIAVNRFGAALITFCTFSATQYPAAGYVYRDAAGRVSAPAVLKSGDTAAVMSQRWGDYTTTVVDPRNGTDFWASGIYGGNNTWATWWANVKVSGGKIRSVRK